jgi:hypothetical protein
MGWMAKVRFLAKIRDFSVLHSLQTGSEAHPATYLVGTGGSFPGGKEVGYEYDYAPPSSSKVKNGADIL